MKICLKKAKPKLEGRRGERPDYQQDCLRENHVGDADPQPAEGKQEGTESPVAQQSLHHAYNES